jgi:hypothetical protein
VISYLELVNVHYFKSYRSPCSIIIVAFIVAISILINNIRRDFRVAVTPFLFLEPLAMLTRTFRRHLDVRNRSNKNSNNNSNNNNQSNPIELFVTCTVPLVIDTAFRTKLATIYFFIRYENILLFSYDTKPTVDSALT